MTDEFIALDMFAGGGGLTEGFNRENFDFAAHIEKDPSAAQTLETRLHYHELVRNGNSALYSAYYKGKIPRDRFIREAETLMAGNHPVICEEITQSTEKSIIKKIRNDLKTNFGRKSVDIVIGGPPCQAYSLVGRGRDLNGMEDDPRNHLYRHYIHFLREFKPEIFVFENVPGIRSAKKGTIFSDLLAKCSDAGYTLQANTLNAKDFGVLQDRKRVIIIGWKKEHDFEYPDFSQVSLTGNVRDLLRDLPVLQAGEGEDAFQRYRRVKPAKYLIETGIRNGSGGIRHHAARFHNERDRKIYRTAIIKWFENGKRLKYNELPEELQGHKNKSAFLDRYKVVDENNNSHAVVAHLAKDGHYFIHPDIRQARSLTIREAARVQSFPDDYLFEGSRGAKYTQIGNAVPPLMAEGIAREIKRMIRMT
ncbi:MAG: DNA cytosine methyltransferase [Methanomicrobiaceae archaeon]|nr:DNA cytosine methyltransferase [Methanomicrobiaceae archaeon]